MEINHICSLGSWCLPAVYIREQHLQRCSYPFDFILSAPEMIVDCLKDDFALFLDKSKYELCKDASTNHTIYGKFSHSLLLDKTRPLNNTFRHHNMTTDKDYNSFIRKVDRFRKLLTNTEPKLFILFSQHEIFTANQIQELNDVLKTKTTNYQIVFVTILEGDRIYHTIEENDNINNIKIITLYTNYKQRGWLSTPNDLYLNEILGMYYKFRPTNILDR